MGAHWTLRRRFLVGLVGLAIVGALSSLLVEVGLGAFDGHYDVTAVFPSSAQGLDTNSEVDMLGVTVGRVGGITLLPDGQARLTLRIDHGQHIPASVSTSIEPLSIFGPEYVNLVPGSSGVAPPYLGPGGKITSTSTSVSFMNLLYDASSALSGVNGNDLSTIIANAAEGVAGLGPEIGQILDDGSQLATVAEAHVPQFEQFVSDVAQLSQDIDADAPDIASTVQNLGTLAPVLAQHSDQEQTLLDQASQLSTELSGYISAHSSSFGAFVDSAATVLQVADAQLAEFPQVFNALSSFFGQLGSAVRLPGPGGVLIGALHGGITDTLCANLILPVNCSELP